MATFIVNSGLAIAIARIKGQRADTTAQPEPVFASWGTGAGVTAATDTALFTETTNSGGAGRVTGTSSIQTTNVSNDTYQVLATLTAPSGITVTNAALFDLVTIGSGNMFMKGDFTGIPLLASDSLQLTFKSIGQSA